MVAGLNGSQPEGNDLSYRTDRQGVGFLVFGICHGIRGRIDVRLSS